MKAIGEKMRATDKKEDTVKVKIQKDVGNLKAKIEKIKCWHHSSEI